MNCMTDALWRIVNNWRRYGVLITDDDAEFVRQLCVRKMQFVTTEDPESYMELLYADEVEWKLVAGKMINDGAYSRMADGPACVPV